MEKVPWSWQVIAVQSRIRLTRSFDQRSHSYLGYCLVVEGVIRNEAREFSIGVGKVAQQKHQFRIGDKARGESVPVADVRREPVEFYRTIKLKMIHCSDEEIWIPPPWLGVPPDLETYRWRGHRRLSVRTYESKCTNCIWGCRMAVEMIVDHWDPTNIRHRFEAFCYGPKSCSFYKAGPRRVVPGRKGMRWEEPDSIDEHATEHRALDE